MNKELARVSFGNVYELTPVLDVYRSPMGSVKVFISILLCS